MELLAPHVDNICNTCVLAGLTKENCRAFGHQTIPTAEIAALIESQSVNAGVEAVRDSEFLETTAKPQHPMVGYLQSLFQKDDVVCIWLIRKQPGKKAENDWIIRSLDQIVEPEMVSHLIELQGQGWDIYVCMNPLMPGSTRRLKDNVAAIRTAYIDIDYEGDARLVEIRDALAEIPEPHFVLRSSPGKYQVVWKVEGFTKNQQEGLLKSLVEGFGGDSAATDCIRVLRLPGFFNLKPAYSRPVIEIIERNDAPGCKLEDFNLAIKPVGDSNVGDTDPISAGRLEWELRRIAMKLRQKGFDNDLLTEALVEICQVRCEDLPDPEQMCRTVATAACEKPVTNSIFDGEPIPHGQHDKTLFSIASGLRGIGLELETTIEALKRVCDRCEGRGDDWEVMCRSKAESAMKYKPAPDDTVLFDGRVVGVDPPKSAPIESSRLVNRAEAERLIAEAQMKEAAAEQAAVAGWRSYFSAVGELEDKPIKMLITNLIPAEGTVFIGALPGEAKTLLALSIAKALTTGRPFLGRPEWSVPTVTPVLHMIPETNDRAFRRRCMAFRLPDDPNRFLCRTISKGMALRLDDPILLETVRRMKPVVILDTLVRFNETDDEKDSAQNRKIADDVSRLLVEGAAGVIILHHASKSMRKDGMTMENVLRGTGDFSASAAAVYGLKRDDVLYANGAGPLEVEVVCFKPRDLDPAPLPFRIAASRKTDSRTVVGEAPGVVSVINETGDFELVQTAAQMARLDSELLEAIRVNPAITEDALKQLTGSTNHKIKTALKRLGWVKKKGPDQVWTQDSDRK